MKYKKSVAVSKGIILSFLFSLSLFQIHTAHALDTEPVFKFANSFFAPLSSSSTSATLTEEELANLTKPAVVRIIKHSYGTTTLTLDFSIDLLNGKLIPLKEKKSEDVPYDLYFSGSGFVVTPDGYIVTNTHVVEKDTSSLDQNIKVLQKALVIDALNHMSEKQMLQFEKKSTSEEYVKLMSDLGEEVNKRLTDNAKTDGHLVITVLDTLSGEKVISGTDSAKDTSLEKIKKLVDVGFPAKVISMHDAYLEDDSDVALLKIEKNNLPAVPLYSAEKELPLATGQKMFTFGFPANADVGGKIGNNYLEPTFTSGMVNSFKESLKKDFKIIQTDAKIASGSSGSPMINQKGEVVGIMTAVTTTSSHSSGDSFAFALPLDPIIKMLGEAKVKPEAGNLYTHFMLGNQYLAEKRCTLAIQQFLLAKNIDEGFSGGDFITPYIEKCKKMQVDKLSIDSEFDLFQLNIAAYKNTIYVSVTALVLLIIIGIFFARRIKQDEDKMDSLMKNQNQSAGDIPQPPVIGSISQTPPVIEQQQVVLQPQAPQPQVQVPSLAVPQHIETIAELEANPRIAAVVAFVKEQSVLPDTTEASAKFLLRNMGYTEDEITKGFIVLAGAQ